MDIDFLIGKNPYDSTTHFSRSLAAALEKKGKGRVRLFPFDKENFFEAIYKISNDPPHLTCSFSDITVADKQPLGDQWGIPHLSLLIDPAIYFLHQATGQFSLLTCVDREDCAFLKQWGCQNVFFLPHGVDESVFCDNNASLYPVVFLGTCIDYEKKRSMWKTLFSQKTVDLLDRAAERVLSPDPVSTLRALLDEKVEHQLPLLHHELDLYITGKERVAVLRALKGIEVHVWGKGPWKKYVPEAVVHREVNFSKAIQIMQKAKIVLNCSPRFKQGSHERLFYGLGCGAMVATGINSYIQENFCEEDGLLFYAYGKSEELVSKIHKALSNDALRKEQIEAGQKKVLFNHSWQTRADQLLSWLDPLFF